MLNKHCGVFFFYLSDNDSTQYKQQQINHKRPEQKLSLVGFSFWRALDCAQAFAHGQELLKCREFLKGEKSA